MFCLAIEVIESLYWLSCEVKGSQMLALALIARMMMNLLLTKLPHDGVGFLYNYAFHRFTQNVIS
jgi:hypothetical protein